MRPDPMHTMLTVLVFTLLTSAAARSCDIPNLRASRIPALSSYGWRWPCASLESITLDITVAGGSVRVYLAVPTDDGPHHDQLCGHPNRTTTCRTTKLVSFASGTCALFLWNRDLEYSATVSGSVDVIHTFESDVSPIVLVAIDAYGGFVICATSTIAVGAGSTLYLRYLG